MTRTSKDGKYLFQVCKDLESGIIGKCCRDANYQDPWPSANLVDGVDDGTYREDNFYGQKELTGNRLTRQLNSTRAVVKRRRLARRPTRKTEDFQDAELCGQRHLVSRWLLASLKYYN